MLEREQDEKLEGVVSQRSSSCTVRVHASQHGNLLHCALSRC